MNSSRGRVALALLVLALLVILGWLLQPGQRHEHAAAPGGAAPNHPAAVARSAGPAATAIVVFRG